METLFAGTSGGTQGPDCLLGDPIFLGLVEMPRSAAIGHPNARVILTNFPSAGRAQSADWGHKWMLFRLCWGKERPETFSYGNLGPKSRPVAEVDRFTFAHHV